MARRLTLTVLVALLCASAVIVSVSVYFAYTRVSHDFADLGVQNAILGSRMTAYVMEKGVANGIFDMAILFDDAYEPIDGVEPPRYHSGYSRYLDKNLRVIQDAFLEAEPIYYAYAITADGYVPVHADPDMDKTRLAERADGASGVHDNAASRISRWRDSSGYEYYQHAAPIFVQRRRWGEFRVGIPVALVRIAVTRELARSAGLTGFLSLLLTVFIVYALRRGLRPLGELARASTAMAQGDLSARGSYLGDDEIGHLTTQFNEMAASIQASHRTLDFQVRERTRDLEQEVAERARAQEALREAKDAAESAARAKAEFLANMSHEIRTPLNGVIGLTGLLLDCDLDDEQRKFAETIEQSAGALLTVIDDILDFSKIDAGRLDLELLDFDLRTTLEEMNGLLAWKPQEKGLEYTCLIEPEVPSLLRGDPGRLRQVITNLVGNAVKFTSAGAIGIHVKLESETDERAVVRFAVTDTGIGIPKERADGLFDAFTQADASTTRQFGGTGLGLSISKNLAEMMGGEIGMESEEGKGSTFWFTADFGKQPPGGAPPATVPDEALESCAGASTHLVTRHAQGEGKRRAVRVLLAEDNATNRMVATKILDKLGFRADAVVNGKEAVEVLKSTSYDLVIMDVQMPEMDGLEATRRIREVGSGILDPGVPIIAMTAHVLKGDRERCIEAGMDDYVSKPVKPQELSDTIERVLRDSVATSRGLAAAPAAPCPEGGLVFDESVLAQMVGDDAEVIGSILDEFTNDAEALVAEIGAAMERGDVPALTAQAHSLKGASGNLGAQRLCEVSTAIERAGRESRLEEAAGMREAMESEFDALIDALAASRLQKRGPRGS